MTVPRRLALTGACIAAAIGAGCDSGDRTEKYVGGGVRMSDASNNATHSYGGDFEVVYGEHYVTVRAKEGNFLFPRERLIFAGPSIATAGLR
jgi:hypothetical protein